jgi:hypothetical protein
LHNHVIQGQALGGGAIRLKQAGGQERPLVGFQTPVDSVVDAPDHVLREDVRQKSQAPAVYPKEGYLIARHEPGSVEQRAIATDSNDEVDVLPNLLLGHALHAGHFAGKNSFLAH